MYIINIVISPLVREKWMDRCGRLLWHVTIDICETKFSKHQKWTRPVKNLKVKKNVYRSHSKLKDRLYERKCHIEARKILKSVNSQDPLQTELGPSSSVLSRRRFATPNRIHKTILRLVMIYFVDKQKWIHTSIWQS